MAEAIYSKTFVGESLASWQVAHEMSTRIEDGSLVVSDSAVLSYHLLRIYGPEFVFRLIRIRCLVKFLPTASANFYIHHFGNLNVAEIDARGVVVDQGISRKISVIPHDLGLLDVEVTFVNCHPTISIGCSDGRHPVYAGTGRDQFVLMKIAVETFDATADLSRIPPEDRVVLVDVGGQGGLQTKWMAKADHITPIIFEPIASEAAAVRKTLCRIPGARVIEKALADGSGSQKLHVSASSDCSSLREPNFEILQRYSIGHLFNTVATEEVECIRFDELFFAGHVPSPDVIKIDVQGFEFEVLTGFGSLLNDCLAIELEAHTVPIYRGQKLLGDLINLLWEWGFSLRNLSPVPHFDGDIIELDALFIKRREKIISLSEKSKKKLSVICEVMAVQGI
ncbi:FkbM family methyltransferase [Bradyrhizobium sp. Arg314]